MPTGARIRTDNVFGTTTDNPLTIGATTMNSAGLANLAAVSSNHAIIILDPLRAAGAPEIVVVTAHTASATSATITRGAYGSTARQHASGTLWVHAPTREDFIQILTSSTRPSDPYRGQLIFETDTNRFVGRDTSDAWQTAVDLGAWTAHTPQIDQGATTNITKTVNYSKWVRSGRHITWAWRLSVTGAGTAGSPVSLTIPVNSAAGASIGMGSALIFDASATTKYNCVVAYLSATQIVFEHDTSTSNAWGATPSVALANGDVILGMATYEGAS